MANPRVPAMPTQHFEYRGLVGKCLGLLLVVAALLKVDGLMSGLVYADYWLSQPRVVLAIVFSEVVLGIWLFVGVWKRQAWVVGVLFFAIAGIAATYSALTGQVYCPCFGRMNVSPWIAIALDIAALSLLCYTRADSPPDREVSTSNASRNTIAITIVVVCSIALILWIFLPDSFVARLRGDFLTVAPFQADAGVGQPGEWSTVMIEITNHSTGEYQILGGTSNCSCVAIEELPVTVSPGKSVQVPIRIRYVGSPGRFARRFVLFTDCAHQRYVTGIVAGRVATHVPHA